MSSEIIRGAPFSLRTVKGERNPVITDSELGRAIDFMMILKTQRRLWTQKQFQNMFDATFEKAYRRDIKDIMKSIMYEWPAHVREVVERLRV